MTVDELFRLRDVDYHYPDGRLALNKISMVVKEGESVVVLGCNGSGKSTLLKLLDALILPTAGELFAFGRRIVPETINDEQFKISFRRRVGFVFQDSEIQLFSPTVLDELAFGPLQLDISSAEVEERVASVLRLLGMEKLRDRETHKLSGGEKKKVAVGSVLTIAPAALLLDEPTNNLDPRTRAWLTGLINDLRAAGRTLVVSTQDLEFAAAVADRVVILDEEHKKAADGVPAALLADEELLAAVNLIHKHSHYHNGKVHEHYHSHSASHRHQH